MKKTLLFIILLAMPLLASAQTRFGYFSFDTMLKEMPEYVKAQADVDNLRRKYDSEMRRAEMEFNSKYEEFLEVQSTLVPTILRKRQTELQDLMEKNVHRVYIDGGQLIQSFLREGLVADIVITTVPVLLGSGKPLFGVLPHDIDLTLLSSRSFPSGLVQSHYRLTA